jgi:hypothetical protein
MVARLEVGAVIWSPRSQQRMEGSSDGQGGEQSIERAHIEPAALPTVGLGGHVAANNRQEGGSQYNESCTWISTWICSKPPDLRTADEGSTPDKGTGSPETLPAPHGRFWKAVSIAALVLAACGFNLPSQVLDCTADRHL